MIGPLLPEQPLLVILLRSLLDREVAFHRHHVPSECDWLTAGYVDGFGAVVAVVRLDLALAGSVGAALALIPRGVTEEWISAGVLTDDAIDNASEVLNVLAAGFNQADHSRHVKLAGVTRPGVEVEAPVSKVIGSPVAHAGYVVNIAGYPGGRLVAYVA